MVTSPWKQPAMPPWRRQGIRVRQAIVQRRLHGHLDQGQGHQKRREGDEGIPSLEPGSTRRVPLVPGFVVRSQKMWFNTKIETRCYWTLWDNLKYWSWVFVIAHRRIRWGFHRPAICNTWLKTICWNFQWAMVMLNNYNRRRCRKMGVPPNHPKLDHWNLWFWGSYILRSLRMYILYTHTHT